MTSFDINESYEKSGIDAGTYLIAELHKVPNLISSILRGEEYVETLAKYATILAKSVELYRSLILKGVHTREELSTFPIAASYGKELLNAAESIVKEYDAHIDFLTDKEDAYIHKSLEKITKESMRESKENMLRNLVYEIKGMHGIAVPPGNYKAIEVTDAQWSIVFRLSNRQFQSLLEVAFITENKFAHEVMKAYISKKKDKIEKVKEQYEEFYNFIKKLLENTPNSYAKEELREVYVNTFNNWDTIFKLLDKNYKTLSKAQLLDTQYVDRFKTTKYVHGAPRDNLQATKYFIHDLEDVLNLDDNMVNRSIVYTETLISDAKRDYRKIVKSSLVATNLDKNKELLAKITADVVKAYNQYSARDKANDKGKERLKAELQLKELRDILIDLDYFLKKDPSRYKNNPIVAEHTKNNLGSSPVNDIATGIYIFTVIIESMDDEDYEDFLRLTELNKVIKSLDGIMGSINTDKVNVEAELKAIDSLDVNHYYLKHYVSTLRMLTESLKIGKEVELGGREIKMKFGLGIALNDVLKLKARYKEELDEKNQKELDRKYPGYEITKSDMLHVLKDNLGYIDFMRNKVVHAIYEGNDDAIIYVEILDKLDDILRGKSSLSKEARVAYLREWSNHLADTALEDLLDMLYAIE